MPKPDRETADNGFRATLSTRIAALRKQHGLSVTALAAAADVSPGFISQVERGQALPSIATLVRIAAALGVRVGELFDTPAPVGRILRRAERTGYAYPNSGLRDEVISSDHDGRLEVLVAYVAPGGGTGGEPYVHGAATEFVLVLDGRIELWIGDEVHHLEKGDTLTFPGTMPHGYLNRWDEPAELLWAMTRASY
jgi:transcriptional regulator with XRE-family HTH domain